MDDTWLLIIGGAILVAGMLYYTAVNERMKSMEKRIQTLEQTIRQSTADGKAAEAAINDELRQLVAQGKNVEAIKEARKAFGLSIVEAKQYVDAL